LDLAINVTCILLDVEALGSTTRASAHEQLTSLVLEALELLRVLVELQVPELLLFDTLRVLLEVRHEVLNLIDLSRSVGMHNLSKVLHEPEVRTHSISQARQLAELGNEGDLVSSASVLVDEQRLVAIVDAFVVASLEVVSVAGLSALLVEG